MIGPINAGHPIPCSELVRSHFDLSIHHQPVRALAVRRYASLKPRRGSNSATPQSSLVMHDSLPKDLAKIFMSLPRTGPTNRPDYFEARNRPTCSVPHDISMKHCWSALGREDLVLVTDLITYAFISLWMQI